MLNKRKGPMFFMQNIDFATEGFKKLLPKKYGSRLFRSPDLYEKGSSYPKQIWICLDALKSEDEKGHYEKGYKAGPKKELKQWGNGPVKKVEVATLSPGQEFVQPKSFYGAQVDAKVSETPLPEPLAKDIEKASEPDTLCVGCNALLVTLILVEEPCGSRHHVIALMTRSSCLCNTLNTIHRLMIHHPR